MKAFAKLSLLAVLAIAANKMANAMNSDLGMLATTKARLAYSGIQCEFYGVKKDTLRCTTPGANQFEVQWESKTCFSIRYDAVAVVTPHDADGNAATKICHLDNTYEQVEELVDELVYMAQRMDSVHPEGKGWNVPQPSKTAVEYQLDPELAKRFSRTYGAKLFLITNELNKLGYKVYVEQSLIGYNGLNQLAEPKSLEFTSARAVEGDKVTVKTSTDWMNNPELKALGVGPYGQGLTIEFSDRTRKPDSFSKFEPRKVVVGLSYDEPRSGHSSSSTAFILDIDKQGFEKQIAKKVVEFDREIRKKYPMDKLDKKTTVGKLYNAYRENNKAGNWIVPPAAKVFV